MTSLHMWDYVKVTLISQTEFDQMLAELPHVLLGNGFSISLESGLSYGELMPKMLENEVIGSALEEMGATDIETALFVLESVRKIVSLKEVYPEITRLTEGIKNEFLRLLSDLHPTRKSEICSAQLDSCCHALRQFDKKFTLNFDPLLYWAELQNIGPWMADGFRGPMDTSNLMWDSEYAANTWWIHGALHHFVDPLEPSSGIYKVTATETDSLMEGVTREMSSGRAPTAVLGGTTAQKLAHIRRNEYLSSALLTLRETRGSILTFGWAAAAQDAHIIKALDNNQVYFGIHNPESRISLEQEARAISFGWKTFNSAWLPFWGPKCGRCVACMISKMQTFRPRTARN